MIQQTELKRKSSSRLSRWAAFFDGMGRVMDLGATGYRPAKKVPFTSFEDDAKALQGDFDRVAADIRQIINSAKK